MNSEILNRLEVINSEIRATFNQMDQEIEVQETAGYKMTDRVKPSSPFRGKWTELFIGMKDAINESPD